MIELLDDKLVLVTAPAGYGKTSLLIDIATQHELPFCWYNLDIQDQDPIRFVAHFIASISQRFPSFGDQSNAALQAMSQGNLPLEHLGTLVVEEIYQVIREHFVIVMDDYHLVAESHLVNTFVNRFAQDSGENCHLVILSRSLLPLEDLPLMVARSQAGGVGIRELVFRTDEIQALMLQNYHQALSSSAAEDLVQKTEGWITGLLLSAQTMWRSMADRIRSAQVSGVGLYDYLTNQVLDQQPAYLRDFLLRTSLLEEFDAKTCEDILGQPPQGKTWQEMLRLVLQYNLFVVPVGENGTCLRYHHLFQDFLQTQLAREQPDENNRILQALANEYEKQEEWAKAHAIYQRLQDIEADAGLLIKAGESLINSGRMSILAKWIDELPADIFFTHPILLARRGMVAAILGNTEHGLSLLDQAVSALRPENNRSYLARTLVWRAMVHRMRGIYAESLIDIGESFLITESDADLIPLRAEALRIKGQNMRRLGKLNEAILNFSESLTFFQAIPDVQGVARLSLELGAAYIDQGDYEMALSYYNHALTYFEAEHNYYALSSTLNDLGVLYYLGGEYKKASDTLEKALTQAKRAGNIRVEALALTSLGDLYKVLDALQAADDAYRQAREIVMRINDPFLISYLDLAEASIALGRGQLSLARQYLASVELRTPKGGSDYTQGLFLYEAGHLALAEENYFEAILFLTQAEEIFESGGQPIEGGRASLLLAKANFEAGDPLAASPYLHEALQLVAHLKSQHSLVVTARETRAMLKALAELPNSRIEALQLLEKVNLFESKIPASQRFLRKQKISVPLEPARIQIQAFGIAQVTMGGGKITSADWQTQITRELFFLLLTHNKGWTKEALGEIIWPESSPAQLKLRFKNTLYRLRHALEQEVVVFDGERYSFNWALDYEYDVENFLDLLLRAEKATDDNEKKRVYREAIQIYQGEYLPEISTTWVIPEREYLHRAFINACFQFAEISLGEGDIESTLDLCRRIFADDPYLEKAHRLAMLAYAATGNRAAIFHQFHQLQLGLRTEFNANPSPETEELYSTLMH